MRALAPFVVVTLCGCGPGVLERWEPATAALEERAHDVAVDFGPGFATLRVTRRFHNTTGTHRGLTQRIPLPVGGTVTSFRISGADGVLERAPLVSVEEATERWEHLTSPGLAAPSTLGRLEWGLGDDGASLELFGVPPGGSVEVAWDVLAPVDYEAGAVALEVPLEDARPGLLPPTFPAGLVDEAAAREGSVRLARAWVTGETFDARWGTFPLDTDRTLWRLELDVAPELSRLPVRPAVVFAVDASHSQGPAGIAAQLELLAPYLAHVPDARVEVVLYRRFAERLFGTFVPASEVAARLAALPPARLAPGNGSHLDRGARLAAEALAAEPGERRLVLLTDDALRDALTPEALDAALAPTPVGTVVHVVSREAHAGDRALSERRHDTPPFAAVAEAWGGIFTRVAGSAADPAQAAHVMRGLVRPVRLDDFTVEAEGLEDELASEDSLEEGAGVQLAGLGARPPEVVTVSGRLWAREVRRVVRVDAAFAGRLPALAVGDDSLRTSLSDDELRTAAFVAGVLSPLTSFLAVPRGAAPSVIGVEEGYGVGGLRLIGCSGGCRFGTSCGFGSGSVGFDAAAHLRGLLTPTLERCATAHGPLEGTTLRFESTRDEVVDVEVTAPTPALTECLTEGTWALRLDDRLGAHRRLQLAW